MRLVRFLASVPKFASGERSELYYVDSLTALPCTGVQFPPSPPAKALAPHKGAFCFLGGDGADARTHQQGELKDGDMFCQETKQSSRGRGNLLAAASELSVTDPPIRGN